MRKEKRFKVRTSLNTDEIEDFDADYDQHTLMMMYLDPQQFMSAKMRREHAKFYVTLFKSPINDPLGEYYMIDVSYLRGSQQAFMDIS